MTTVTVRKALSMLKFLILPLLLAVFPPFFFYGNNVAKLLIPSLGRMLLLYSAVSVLVFIVYNFVFKGRVVKAANATFVFLIFFNVYGFIYKFLSEMDVFRVEHYTLLPLFLFMGIYSSWLVGKASGGTFWNSAVAILALLVIFSWVKIVPGEITKQQLARQAEATQPPVTNTVANENHPDIYLIIFDEFAGLDVAKEYWDYQEVDDFVDFVQSKGFFVAENSRSRSIVTLHLMAELFNYQEFPVDPENINIYYNEINDSRAIRYLKSLGYTTVSFDETRYWYDTYTPMPVDHPFFYEESNQVLDVGDFFDEFSILVAENTMLKAFEFFYKPLSAEPMAFEQHREYVFFTSDKIGSLNHIPSPKFVYVHLMLPHHPFLFDANGERVDPIFYQDWSYYLDQYKFTISIMEKMIDTILRSADPKRPPIVIIQSDHGARNGFASWHPDAAILEDYPMEYANHILNIMFLPGFDISQLPPDMKPINTFPIIFNYYFNEDIPLVK